MDDDTAAQRLGSCPHVNRNDPRCASRFCLGRLDQAFTVCFGSFHGCPMFHRINVELAEVAAREQTAVVVTIGGHELQPALRATGT